MALNTHEQFLTILERSKRPLIVLTENANSDDFVSAFGVSALLTKLQKPVEVVGSNGQIPKSIDFLKSDIKIYEDIKNIRKMILKVNAKSAKVDELSYSVENDELNIHILPKNGSWNSNDVQIITNSYKYDLIIAIGGVDLESFGLIFTQYKDFFFNTPIINIDHNNSNDYFGQINLIDMNAVSCSEVCYNVFRNIDEELIDEDVATYFLTGMIFKTKSFKSENVTPKTLKIAGDLMVKGARRKEIIQKLYKTKSIETLRLWGRALARLKSDSKNKIVWTLLTRQDFVNASTDEAALENIIDELIMSAPEAKIAALLFERQNKTIVAILNVRRPFDALSLGSPFRASGTRTEVLLKMREDDIVQAEKSLITHIKNQVKLF